MAPTTFFEIRKQRQTNLISLSATDQEEEDTDRNKQPNKASTMASSNETKTVFQRIRCDAKIKADKPKMRKEGHCYTESRVRKFVLSILSRSFCLLCCRYGVLHVGINTYLRNSYPMKETKGI